MSQEMDTLQQKVTAMSGVVDSAVLAFTGLAEQIRDAAGDKVKSLALATELDGKAQALAAAIPQNAPPGDPGDPTARGRR